MEIKLFRRGSSNIIDVEIWYEGKLKTSRAFTEDELRGIAKELGNIR